MPSPAGARKVHATLRCRSTLRRRSVDLTIFDYHCVAVRSRRGGSGRKYVLDLRFIEPAVRLSRHVPWRWIGVALALTLLAALLGWRSETSSTHLRQIIGGAAAAGLTIAATCAYIIAAFRLTETIAVRTLHGRAAVLEYTGGLGTLRTAHLFVRRLAAHIRLASAARRPIRAEHLRDELREHYRLRAERVLSQEQYEQSKARILAEHTPGPPRRSAG